MTTEQASRRDDVSEDLREAVLRGQFAPRQRLVESELCEELGASRAAVRDALHRLEVEGIVEREHHRGARIREIPLAEAIEIAEVRQLVEGLVARRAAQLAGPADVDRLTDVGRRMREAVAAGELGEYLELDAELHAILREVSGHRTAARVLERIRGQLVRQRFALARVPGRAAVSLEQHLAVIDAVVAHEPVAAEAAMRAHIDSVIDTLQALG
ncbi:GntR family transcriptional regulator [Actinotalea sp. M2MS4P-6]|uniref:GntR family transcriptional regulator n=1 Tax=Actinotalea sp. M2MS4P-6 TaxID=2983762 RepID=UPI0021E39EE5|nr:GntR family transcriptional regulator [Actinotalea sp. M2MS4P-6]MCV2394399.1 GntR family transcriptional regulator [Actinotalea sp. M2MS4P-6]